MTERKEYVEPKDSVFPPRWRIIRQQELRKDKEHLVVFEMADGTWRNVTLHAGEFSEDRLVEIASQFVVEMESNDDAQRTLAREDTQAQDDHRDTPSPPVDMSSAQHTSMVGMQQACVMPHVHAGHNWWTREDQERRWCPGVRQQHGRDT